MKIIEVILIGRAVAFIAWVLLFIAMIITSILAGLADERKSKNINNE